ncbi:alpha/beta hydrolase [Schaalia odontolytica]|uniref:alpha/beta hydrolase n=1 Tax=Schaalia odontolytica TaxID=1660 RepID=UPI0028D76677|nr:alpha/beta hydrolase [Schaalia odontolytica]
MAFDPRRDVTVSSGAFSVDVDELCAAHTLMSAEEALSIAPARLALEVALGETEAVSGLVPEASARLASAITGALSSLNSLEREIDSLRWKLQEAALTYTTAESGSSLWELVPGSPIGPQLSLRGLGMWALGPAIPAIPAFAGATALVHGTQDASVRAGVPWLPTLLMPGLSALVTQKDLCDTVIDGVAFGYHSDEMSGARFQRDLGRFALDVNSSPVYRGVARALAGMGVSQDLNSMSTQSASGVAALIAPWAAYVMLVDFGRGHGASYGVAVRGADGDTRIHPNGLGSRVPSRAFDARTQSALAAMPEAAPDTHHEGVTTSADAIEHITEMRGGDADNGEIAIEEHLTVGKDGVVTRSWTVDIRGTQSFDIGQTGPQDMTTNLQGVAGMSSDQLDAIKEAMNAAGIAPGEAVEFAGHSQGGIMAAQMAADPSVRARYNVVSVVTAGSPTATIAPSDVPVLSYENSGDIVPGLDGNGTRGDNVTTVAFRDYEATCHADDPVPCSHSAPLYVDEIRRTLAAARTSSDPGLTALAAAEARRTQALGLTQNTQTTIHHYQTRRITQG